MSTDNQAPPPETSDAPKPILPVADAEAKLQGIAERQGTLGTATFEKLLGAGTHLWATDEEFDRFQQLIRESRSKE